MSDDAPSVQLRLAQPDDIVGLLTLLPHLSSRPTSDAAAVPPLADARRIFERMQRQGNIFVIVATVEDEEATSLVGTCTLVVVPNFTHGGRPWTIIENVVVAAMARGRGFGALLLEYAFDLARRHDCYKVQLVSGPKEEQHRFYRRLGFDNQRCRGFKKLL